VVDEGRPRDGSDNSETGRTVAAAMMDYAATAERVGRQPATTGQAARAAGTARAVGAMRTPRSGEVTWMCRLAVVSTPR